MFNVHQVKIEWGGRPLTLETGKIARQANGAVMVTYGETTVLCTVAADRKVDPTRDFFPLSVHYQEKAYAAGKIPGGFFKRETKPSEKETLTSRLIDRPLRPLFPDLFRQETQVICTVLSHDLENDPAIPSMIGASAALTLSGIPFLGPIAGAHVGYINGDYVLNPTLEQMAESDLDLIVAGTQEGVLMVESEAKELNEDIMLKAVMFGHKAFQPVIKAIINLAEEAAKDPWELTPRREGWDGLVDRVKAMSLAKIQAAYALRGRVERGHALNAAEKELSHSIAEPEATFSELMEIFHNLEKEHVRTMLLTKKLRIDGRSPNELRPIVCETGLLSRTHGSALFTRGETQALVVTTLGTGEDEQIVDALEGEYKEKFMLHYNFPPFSVGEVGRMGAPGRREIGHGRLAWRAVSPLLPKKEAFPYTVRVVSEITESNGSSSMASVCGASLSLMDAGVPLKTHVAGIAMGLIKEGNEFVVLSDISGDEDHLGDMDFKVAGTRNGVTALQMDLKITSVNEAIMREALQQAHEGRQHILSIMESALEGAREEVNKNAPHITHMKIPKDKIRDVIGSGGKVIRELCEQTGAKVDIDDDGGIMIAAANLASVEEAKNRIIALTATPELGQVYSGKVVKIMEFGAFVDFLNASGLVHVSEIAATRVEKVADVLKVGDMVKVKLIGFDDRGKIKLSMKQVDGNPAAGA